MPFAVVENVRDLMHDIVGERISLPKVIQRHIAGHVLIASQRSIPASIKGGETKASEIDVRDRPGAVPIIEAMDQTVYNFSSQKNNRPLRHRMYNW